MLLKEWGCDGSFDFFYLPRSCATKSNLSYAFINFTTEALAETFRATWHRARLSRFRAQKALNVGYADLQGFDANLHRLVRKRNYCTVPQCQCEPIVFLQGRRVPWASIASEAAQAACAAQGAQGAQASSGQTFADSSRSVVAPSRLGASREATAAAAVGDNRFSVGRDGEGGGDVGVRPPRAEPLGTSDESANASGPSLLDGLSGAFQ